MKGKRREWRIEMVNIEMVEGRKLEREFGGNGVDFWGAGNFRKKRGMVCIFGCEAVR
jgi:hypothetical protein